MDVQGFEWDDGNWPKCSKHGLSKEDIEFVFKGVPRTSLDPFPSEQRYRAVGRTIGGRFAFIVFTIRETQAGNLIRPISARYMHAQEVQDHGH